MIRKYFIAGLVFLLPLLVTYLVVAFCIHLVTRPFEGLVYDLFARYHLFDHGWWIFSHNALIHLVSRLLILVALAVLIIAIGAWSRHLLFRWTLHCSDRVLAKLPFVKGIYLACKDFTGAIFGKHTGTFSQVVLVPYPAKGRLAIGLVTNELRSNIIDPEGREVISVLLPGTPNPTIGFVLFFLKQDVIFTDMSVHDAIKYVMSCGSAVPDHLSLTQLPAAGSAPATA